MVASATSRADRFTVGPDGSADLVLEGLPEGAELRVRRDGEEAFIAGPGGVELRLAPRAPLEHRFGELSLRVERVAEVPAPVVRGPRDWRYSRIFATAALAHGFLIAAALITPPARAGMVETLTRRNSVFTTTKLLKEEPAAVAAAPGPKAKEKEGRRGERTKRPRDAAPSRERAQRVDPEQRARDHAVARRAGLLGILAGEGGAIANVFSAGGLGTGINVSLGGLSGATLGDAGGAGGLGSRGTGGGGDGGSLGIGGLGTHGNGRGERDYGDVKLGADKRGGPRLLPGRTILEGSLGEAEIGRVIRQNLPRFKHCYERELTARPELAGKVALGFTIAPNGRVADPQIRESSLDDGAVERCLVSVLSTLEFPKPRGGGVVVVTYPFIFASS